MVDIWSIFGFFVWWSIFDKTPLASLEQLSSHVSPFVKSGVNTAFIQEPEKKPQESVIQEREQG